MTIHQNLSQYYERTDIVNCNTVADRTKGVLKNSPELREVRLQRLRRGSTVEYDEYEVYVAKYDRPLVSTEDFDLEMITSDSWELWRHIKTCAEGSQKKDMRIIRPTRGRNKIYALFVTPSTNARF